MRKSMLMVVIGAALVAMPATAFGASTTTSGLANQAVGGSGLPTTQSFTASFLDPSNNPWVKGKSKKGGIATQLGISRLIPANTLGAGLPAVATPDYAGLTPRATQTVITLPAGAQWRGSVYKKGCPTTAIVDVTTATGSTGKTIDTSKCVGGALSAIGSGTGSICFLGNLGTGSLTPACLPATLTPYVGKPSNGLLILGEVRDGSGNLLGSTVLTGVIGNDNNPAAPGTPDPSVSPTMTFSIDPITALSTSAIGPIYAGIKTFNLTIDGSTKLIGLPKTCPTVPVTKPKTPSFFTTSAAFQYARVQPTVDLAVGASTGRLASDNSAPMTVNSTASSTGGVVSGDAAGNLCG